MKLLLVIAAWITFFQPEPFKADLDSYLKEQLKSYERYDSEVISSPKLQPGEKLAIDTERQMKLAGNMAYVPVKIVHNSSRSSQSVISLRVKLFRNVFVAKTPVKYGQELKAADFELKLTDISQLRGTAIENLAEIHSAKTKNNIRQGDVLIKEVLMPLPVVRSGERISALFQRGNVVITLDATAKQDGSPGSTVRIQTPDGKFFRAKVIDANSVKIQE
ncbi:MAG: flagellar basal body P-ring formation chaperone FlgA [Bacillota bacterium]